MANALAIAGCFTMQLGVLNSAEEELNMTRNLRFPYGAYGGILGAFLAQKGFKGPLNVFEGHRGLNEVVVGGERTGLGEAEAAEKRLDNPEYLDQELCC